MNITITVKLIISLSAGGLLGWIYFWGLWKTVRLMVSRKHAGWIAAASFGVRAGFVITGFYLLLMLDWQYLAVAMVGFLAARVIVIRRYGLAERELVKSG